ncbi:hypothetical protein MNBD_GAMMA20-1253 [hydrothermal vent metagenome]|uniref:Uncharacterized protein n=1 Tax=hydrothermal vent metagenome TaxID=652676 RepID=A0A3B1AYA4_9ZZZZ
MNGTKDRKERISCPKSGTWGSSSQDLVRLSTLLIESSKDYALKYDRNISIYALAGIPVLFSALRALLLEANNGMYGRGKSESKLHDLNKINELKFVDKYYNLGNDALENLRLAYEVRNEIVHPSHMPAGTPDGTPEYLSVLRKRGLLQSGIWLDQLQSHKLILWIAEVIKNVASKVLEEHHADQESKQDHLCSWSRYKMSKL